MSKRRIGALAALNLILLMGWVLVELSPEPVSAQAAAQAVQAKHDYMMVSGLVRGRANQDAVYIFERRTGRMVVIFHDSATKKTTMIAQRPRAQQKKR